jgi:thiol-disulfide isomerase/thioredoxin
MANDRRRPHRLAVMLATLLLPALQAQATVELVPGDNAPAIMASKWLRGGPIDRFAAGSVYVLDFWATWCKPCISTMPQMKALEDRHRDSLVVIAMNVWEMKPDAVSGFVTAHLKDMPSFVAMDSIPPGKEANLGLTVAAYLGTSDLYPIPRVYLIGKDGRVAWIGAPNDLDAPLAQVMSDRWDLKAFEQGYKQRLADEQKLQATLAQVTDAVAKSNWDEAMGLCENSVISQPQTAPRIARSGFMHVAFKMLSVESPGTAQIEAGLRAIDRGLELLDLPDWRLYLKCAQLTESVGQIPKSLEYLSEALRHAPPEERVAIESELKRLAGD